MPIIETNEMRGNVVFGLEETREGKTSLVFIHGVGGNWTAWHNQREYFSRDYNVLVMELPGHGAVAGKGAREIKSYSLWIKGVLEELKIADPFIIGHSMGGAIAMDLAMRFPAFPRGLVLVSTGARLRVLPRIIKEIQEGFPQAVRFICGLSFAKNVPEEIIELASAEMIKNPPQVLLDDFTACDQFDVMAQVETIGNATLVICGDQDILTPPAYSRFLADKIGGSRMETVEGAGHMVMLERPDEFNRKLDAFFRSVSRGDA